MAEGAMEARSRDGWSRMAPLLALTANIHRDPKKCKALTPEDCDPWSDGKKAVIQKVPLKTLKSVFVREKRKAKRNDGRGDKPKKR